MTSGIIAAVAAGSNIGPADTIRRFPSVVIASIVPSSLRNPARATVLGPLLKSVSRSFYLTLRVLPESMRDPIGLAYLLARAADTIADTSVVPPERRLALLLRLREQVDGDAVDGVPIDLLLADIALQQTQSDEKQLLESLGPALAVLDEFSPSDQLAVRAIVSTLSQGMEFDLRTFPDEQSGKLAALQTFDELDQYTYQVAGCVGEFWTSMTYAHMPGTLKVEPGIMVARGIRFGKALQMTNVLRDCSKDVRIGRCYIPQTLLAQFGLSPHDLLAPDNSVRAQPLLFDLVRVALAHFRAAVAYTLAIPAFSVRLRLACLWPVFIGLETLLLLVQNEAWLDPARVSKVSRSKVYGIIARSLPMVISDRSIQRSVDGLMGRIEARMKHR